MLPNFNQMIYLSLKIYITEKLYILGLQYNFEKVSERTNKFKIEHFLKLKNRLS